MATENLDFGASVDAWVRATEQRMEAVFKESTQRIIEEVRKPEAKGGKMPVDTGYLRNSLVATTDGPTLMSRESKPEAGRQYDQTGDALPQAVSLTITNAKLGQTIWACFTAAYAARMEYGFSGEDSLGRSFNQKGRGFVRLATQRWQSIVDAVVKELKERSSDNR